jgi:hypothetical protein
MAGLRAGHPRWRDPFGAPFMTAASGSTAWWLWNGKRLRRQIGNGDPFDAPRQLAIGFHEFLHSPPRQRKSRVWPHETGALTRKPAGLLIGHEEMSG